MITGHYANRIPLSEVVAVHSNNKYSEEIQHDSRRSGSPVYIEMRPVKPVEFTVHYIKRIPHYKWKVKKTVFSCPTDKAYMCQLWVLKLKDAIRDLGTIIFHFDSHLSCW